MAKQCTKCGKKIGFGESNPFINEQDEHIVLCDCYFLLSKNEKKKLVYIGKPKSARGKYKPTGLVFGGLVGSVPYSAGYNSGEHWMLNRRKNKTEYTQKQIDEMSIDMFNAHWDFLPAEDKQELLKGEEDEYVKAPLTKGKLLGISTYREVEKKEKTKK